MGCLERPRRIAVLSLAVFVVGVALVIVFNVYLLSSVQNVTFIGLHRVVTRVNISGTSARRRIKLDTTSKQEQLRRRWIDLQATSKNWTVDPLLHHLDHQYILDERALDLNAARLPRQSTEQTTAIPIQRQWAMAGNWVQARQIYPENPSGMTGVLKALSTQPIIKAEAFKRGTQFKVLLLLKGGQRAMMKPMRYKREAFFNDTPYAGADRHNGEIAAFHLSRLLGLRWCPLASGRAVNLNHEILPVADKYLSRTFFNQSEETCFYGVCHYCSRQHPVCTTNGTFESVLILWLPVKYRLKPHRHPWARTYRRKMKAAWEKSDDYCQRVKKISSYRKLSRLLDLIDVAIFDFLIGNADRHSFETFEGFNNSAILLLDNGKSFGNANNDEVTILAPLYQCCLVRSTTVETLRRFSGRTLSSALESLLKIDPLYPILTEAHLYALDRRRYKVLDAIALCLDQRSQDDVLRSDYA